MPTRPSVSCVEVMSPELLIVMDSPDLLDALMPSRPEKLIEPLLSMEILDASGSRIRTSCRG